MVSRFIVLFLFSVTLKVSGIAQNSPIIIPTSHNDKILQIVIDQQNKYFYTGDTWQIIMWDFKTMKQLFTFHVASKSIDLGFGDKVANYKNLTISPDGNVLAYTTNKDSLKIYSTLSGEMIRTIPNVKSKLIFSKDSKIIYHLTYGPTIKGNSYPDGRMVQTINIASGLVNDYWHLKDLNNWGSFINYFYPLTNSRVINFNEKGYTVLDLDDKKEIASFQIPEEIEKKLLDPKEVFNNRSFRVLAEAGLFVFQQHRKDGLGWATWDIFNNKEFAFFPAYAEITFQESFNSGNVLYSTKGTRVAKQEVAIYSKGFKIEKKKICKGGDEIRVAALCKKNNTIIYADFEQNLYTTNLDVGEKKMVARGLPNINIYSFFREANTLSFNGSKPAINPNDSYATYYNYNSNYVVDLSKASLQSHDTLPSKPLSTVLPVKLSKDSFLLMYDFFNADDQKCFIYDKNSKKNSPLILKNFGVSQYSNNSIFRNLPSAFTLSTPNVVYFSAEDPSISYSDRLTFSLYKYNFQTKKTEQIFTSSSMIMEKWKSLGGTPNNYPITTQQLIIDKESEILVSAENDFKGSINIIDIKSGKILAKYSFSFDSLMLENNINRQTLLKTGNTYRPFNLIRVKRLKNDVVRVLASEYIYDFNLADGSVKEKKIIDGTMFDNKYNVKIFGDHSLENIFVSYEDENESVVKTVYGPNKIKLDHITSSINQFEFTQNDSVLYTIHADNSINTYNAITGKYYGSLYTFENSKDWVFVGEDGRFDGTEKGMSKLYYLKQREIITIDKVYEKYYTPNLYLRLVAGEKFDPLPEIDLKPKPKTKILYAEKQRNLEVEEDIAAYTNTTGLAEITVNATADEDKVDEIRLFHNGKVVNLATRGLFVTDADGSESKKYTINLLPGNNNFRAIALNSQRTESDADEIAVIYKADGIQTDNKPIVSNTNTAAISPVDKNATLHLVVVGINAYNNPAMSLNYALADATAFKTEIEKDAKTVISNIKTYFVTDADASKTGILEAFKQVQQNAKAQDVFIFYYAGHGVIGKDKEFYLVPNDVSDLKNVQAELEQKGIAAKLLQQYAIDIQAQKQLFILDACQSARAFNEMLSTSGEQQKSIAVVSRSTGTHWMAASGAQQYANEFSQLGHGAFTYVLLQALNGSAANNKMITVNGLKNYIQLEVPELMKKYSGTLQYPASYGFGNDFPVEVMK